MKQEKLQEYEIRQSTLLLLCAGMVMGGSMVTIVGKMMNQPVKIEIETQTEQGLETMTKAVEFKHPLFLNAMMFIGEMMLLLFLKIQLAGNREAQIAHDQNKARPTQFMAPAILDVCGSFLNFTGLALISASTYQIMKMLSLVFVAILSMTFLGHRYSFVQWMSVAVVITGLTVVSFASLDEKAGETTEETEESVVETGHG